MRLQKNKHLSLMETINHEMSVEKTEESRKKAIFESWQTSSPLSKRDADQLLGQIERAYKKGGLKSTFTDKVNNESMPIWELIQGLPEFLYGESQNMIGYVLDKIKRMLSPSDLNDKNLAGVFESVGIEEEIDFANMEDKDMANLVLRYNQVVNRALRARFISRTRRRSL